MNEWKSFQNPANFPSLMNHKIWELQMQDRNKRCIGYMNATCQNKKHWNKQSPSTSRGTRPFFFFLTIILRIKHKRLTLLLVALTHVTERRFVPWYYGWSSQETFWITFHFLGMIIRCVHHAPIAFSLRTWEPDRATIATARRRLSHSTGCATADAWTLSFVA